MAAYNCAGEGQTAMVTFRTGEGQSLPQLGVPMGLRKSSQAKVRPPSLVLPLTSLPVPVSCGLCPQAKAPPLSRMPPASLSGAPQVGMEIRPHFQCPALLAPPRQPPWQKALCEEGDLILRAPSLAELNLFLLRTAAQT